ncbi:MAG: tetratricopeptide repeat protein [Phycisphaerales bacterium]
MRLKPKTVRRMTLLGLVVLLVLGGAFSLFVVRQWQKGRAIDRFAREAEEKVAQGQYYPALIISANYLKRNPTTHPRYADMLKTYADCRMKVEEADQSHVRQAVSFYLRYLEQRPDDRETQELVLDLLLQSHYWAEARELAAKLLPADLSAATAEDAPTLRAEALALYAVRGDPARLFRVLDRLSAVQPLNVRNETVRLQALGQANRPAEARAYAEGLLKAHPEDPRAELILVVARMIDRRPGEAQDQWERVCRAAGLETTSPTPVRPVTLHDQDFAGALIEVFNEVAAYDHSLFVLEAAAAAFDDVPMRRMLARRLWQEGRHEDVLKLTGALDPRTSDSEQVGFRGLALVALKRTDEAKALAAALREKDGDYRATTWSKAIPLMAPDGSATGAARIEQAREIVKASPYEPVFLLLLGDALAAVGRADEARRYWEDAGRNAQSVAWDAPHTRVAESCFADGRYDDAARAASAALARSPGSVPVNLLWIETQAALIQRGSGDAPPVAGVLERIDRLLAGVAGAGHAETLAALGDRLLPTRVLLISRDRQRDKAIELARGALAAQPSLSEESLRRLGAVSEAEHLGLEGECLAQAEARFGDSSAVALARALATRAAGDPEGAMTTLRKAAHARPGDLSYHVALARFLERIGDSGALKAWMELGDRHPSSLEAQRACLTSAVTPQDRAFIEKTIQRYTALMGPDAIEDYYARMARARSLVAVTPTRRARDEAAAILGSLVGANPSLVEPRLALAGVLAMSDPSNDIHPDLPRAVSQLRDAATKEPRSARVALELAKLHQAQREWERSREQLHRVATDTTFDGDSRAEAARLLILQGEPGPLAVRTLSELVEQQGEGASPATVLLLAEAHAALRDDAKARAIYEGIVARAREPESILMGARFFARAGEGATAQAALARLDTMPLSPGLRDLTLARFEAEQGSPERAVERFEAAVAVTPAPPDAWRHYAGFVLTRGDHSAAAAVIERGLKATPEDPSLRTMREQAKVLASGNQPGDLKDLIEALSKDPATTQAAQTLRLLKQAMDRGELRTHEDMVRLADRYPGSAPLQMYAARQVAPADMQRAAVLASRAVAAAPADPAPARLAAEIYLRLGRWNDMLAAAEAWRQRDPARGPEADLAVAEACLHLGRHARGLEVLTPRVGAALASPREAVSLGVLNMQARLLIVAGRSAEARSLLAPLLAESRDVRVALWMAIAGRDLATYDEARSWIEQVRPMLPTESADEQLVLVMVLDSLSTRFPQHADGLLAESRQVLTRLAENPATATGLVLEALGILRHRTQDLTGAEAAYQRAIELDPTRAMAMNNLASLALESRGNVEEALTLARRAVDLDPNAAHLDTLAHAQRIAAGRLKGSDPEGAKRAFTEAGENYDRSAKAAPGSPNPLAAAAACFEEAGALDRAAACYEQLIATPGLAGPSAAYVKNNLAIILTRINTPESLQRARVLALEATRAVPEPSTFDTLGWVELGLGDRARAAEAFRRALAGRGERPPMASAAIGLALALADGSAAERQEAAAAIEGVKPEALASDLLAHYARAREALGGMR